MDNVVPLPTGGPRRNRGKRPQKRFAIAASPKRSLSWYAKKPGRNWKSKIGSMAWLALFLAMTVLVLWHLFASEGPHLRYSPVETPLNR